MKTFREHLTEDSKNKKMVKFGKRGSVKIEISYNKGFVKFDEINRKFDGDDNTIGIKHFKDNKEATKIFDILDFSMTDSQVLKYLDKP